MMRADEPTEAVEDGAVDVPIRSPIGSLRRAEVAACVLAAGAARTGAISITLGGVGDCEFGASGMGDSAVRRLAGACAVGLAKNGAG